MKSKNDHIKLPKRKIDDNDTLVYKNGRTIYFYADVNNESICKTIRFLDELEKESKKEIMIKICSSGGYVYSGFALYDRIRQSVCQINTIGTGIVASMALIIYLAGDYRSIEENATLLNHQACDEIEGRIEDLKIAMKETERIEQRVVEIIACHTGLTERKIINDIQKGDNYIKPERAVDEGFAHELIKNDRIIRKRRKKK